ncbi:MAG: GNAT family N-acetyltransferase [Pseudomonadota bacterium]
MIGIECTVRRARQSDIEDLLTLMRDFYAESGFTLEATTTADALQALLSSPALGRIWIAYQGSVVIGHAVLTVRFTMEHEGLSGYIDDLFVRPLYRRSGVGRGLLKELVAEARVRGCKSLQVEVGQSNTAALALYKSFGLNVATDGRVLASGRLAESPHLTS